jgi:hypothetical protein
MRWRGNSARSRSGFGGRRAPDLYIVQGNTRQRRRREQPGVRAARRRFKQMRPQWFDPTSLGDRDPECVIALGMAVGARMGPSALLKQLKLTWLGELDRR